MCFEKWEGKKTCWRIIIVMKKMGFLLIFNFCLYDIFFFNIEIYNIKVFGFLVEILKDKKFDLLKWGNIFKISLINNLNYDWEKLRINDFYLYFCNLFKLKLSYRESR